MLTRTVRRTTGVHFAAVGRAARWRPRRRGPRGRTPRSRQHSATYSRRPATRSTARASVRPSAALGSAAGAAVGRAALRPAARPVARARATNRAFTPALLSPLLASRSPAKQDARAQRQHVTRSGAERRGHQRRAARARARIVRSIELPAPQATGPRRVEEFSCLEDGSRVHKYCSRGLQRGSRWARPHHRPRQLCRRSFQCGRRDPFTVRAARARRPAQQLERVRSEHRTARGRAWRGLEGARERTTDRPLPCATTNHGRGTSSGRARERLGEAVTPQRAFALSKKCRRAGRPTQQPARNSSRLAPPSTRGTRGH